MLDDNSFFSRVAVSQEIIDKTNLLSRLHSKRALYLEKYKADYLEHLKNEYNILKKTFPEVNIEPEARIKGLKSYNEKVNRVISSLVPNAPQETLLVIDATTGQNGISQAKNFKEITNITGIVLTKLDGTAKGGIVLAIKDEVNIPVKFIGLGEQIDDLRVFDLEKYVYGLFKEMM